jgi:hypothetical protein
MSDDIFKYGGKTKREDTRKSRGNLKINALEDK